MLVKRSFAIRGLDLLPIPMILIDINYAEMYYRDKDYPGHTTCTIGQQFNERIRDEPAASFKSHPQKLVWGMSPIGRYKLQLI